MLQPAGPTRIQRRLRVENSRSCGRGLPSPAFALKNRKTDTGVINVRAGRHPAAGVLYGDMSQAAPLEKSFDARRTFFSTYWNAITGSDRLSIQRPNSTV